MCDMDIDQEIRWVKEEIEADETVMNSAERSGFHAGRLAENRAKLQELLELKPND